MADLIETIEQRATRLGVSYFFAGSNLALGDSESIDICVDAVNGANFFIRSVIIDANADSATWQMYLGHVPQAGTGIDLPLNSRNPGASVPMKPVIATQDPALIEQGEQLFPIPRTILGDPAPGNAAFMYKELLTGGYIVPKGGSVLFRITNTSGSAREFSILMSGRDNLQ